MACTYCRHFNLDVDEHDWPLGRDDKLSVIENVTRETGQCTLSPTWQKVTGLHYCSQFSPQNARYIGMFWRSMHEESAGRREERELRLVAEKKLKALRARKKS